MVPQKTKCCECDVEIYSDIFPSYCAGCDPIILKRTCNSYTDGIIRDNAHLSLYRIEIFNFEKTLYKKITTLEKQSVVRVYADWLEDNGAELSATVLRKIWNV